jgi:outer membrane protein assembly factor BamE (lipoprotein component of BamABCDE complex)
VSVSRRCSTRALPWPLLCILMASCSTGSDPEKTRTELGRSEFDAIPLGSTTDDVAHQLGSPFLTAFGAPPTEHVYWCYGSRAETGTGCRPPVLTFDHGKVVSRLWDEAALEAQRPEELAAGVTRQQFEAMPEGSSQEDARKALGAPLMAVTTVSAKVGNELHWCYGKRASETGVVYTFPMLTFVDGRLRRRAWFGRPWDDLDLGRP